MDCHAVRIVSMLSDSATMLRHGNVCDEFDCPTAERERVRWISISARRSTHLCTESIVKQRCQSMMNGRCSIFRQRISIRRRSVQFHIEIFQCSSHTIDHFFLNLDTTNTSIDRSLLHTFFRLHHLVTSSLTERNPAVKWPWWNSCSIVPRREFDRLPRDPVDSRSISNLEDSNRMLSGSSVVLEERILVGHRWRPERRIERSIASDVRDWNGAWRRSRYRWSSRKLEYPHQSSRNSFERDLWFPRRRNRSLAVSIEEVRVPLRLHDRDSSLLEHIDSSSRHPSHCEHYRNALSVDSSVSSRDRPDFARCSPHIRRHGYWQIDSDRSPRWIPTPRRILPQQSKWKHCWRVENRSPEVFSSIPASTITLWISTSTSSIDWYCSRYFSISSSDVICAIISRQSPAMLMMYERSFLHSVLLVFWSIDWNFNSAPNRVDVERLATSATYCNSSMPVEGNVDTSHSSSLSHFDQRDRNKQQLLCA